MANNGLNIDDLQIEISVDVSKAVQALNHLASAATSSTKSVENSFGSMVNKVSSHAKKLTSSVSDTTTAVQQLDETINDTAADAEETSVQFEKAAKGGLAKFFGTVKRLATYRAIRSALKFLSEAVREGFNMFVTWDKEQNNYMAGTALNVEKLTEKWSVLKGQIGALGGALFNGLAPVITWVVEQLTKLVDLLQMVFRSLQGEYSYYKMIYTAAKATTAQAKELKRVLFGFDELNVLPSQSGGGGTLSQGSWAYQEVPIDSRFLNSIADASNKFKELFGITDDGQKTLGFLTGAIGVFLGGKALGGLIKLLPSVTNLFKGKNKALGDQTSKVTADATATEGLATKLGLALGAASAFSIFLKQNPLNVNINKPALDFTSDINAISTAKQFAAANPVEVKFNTTADLSSAAQVATAIMNLVALGARSPILMSISAPFSQITSAFATMFNTIQRFFNNHPVKIPIAVANGAMTGAGSIVSGLSSSVSNTYASSAAWSNMSATDLVNYAESTGLNMTQQDRQVAAATVASIFSAFATGGVLGLAGGAMSIADILKSIGLGAIFGFANGGMISNTGSLFYAGEAGAEIVANLGHSTGVMNVSQMQDAVANGNVEVVNAIYALANTVITTVNNKNFDVYMDAAKVGQSVSKYQYNQARRGVTQGAY